MSFGLGRVKMNYTHSYSSKYTMYTVIILESDCNGKPAVDKIYHFTTTEHARIAEYLLKSCLLIDIELFRYESPELHDPCFIRGEGTKESPIITVPVQFTIEELRHVWAEDAFDSDDEEDLPRKFVGNDDELFAHINHAWNKSWINSTSVPVYKIYTLVGKIYSGEKCTKSATKVGDLAYLK